MCPQIECDEKNGLAYITFSDHDIERSIESEDELLVFDIDKQGELVGIEIMSVWRLQQQSSIPSPSQFSPEMIAMFLIPQLFQYAVVPTSQWRYSNIPSLLYQQPSRTRKEE